MTVSRSPQPRKRRRSRFRFLFAVTVTTVMIATGGFGAFPDNSLTQTFQEVISENVSADFLQPFNSYMENISAPTIQPGPDSGSEPSFDLIGTLAGPASAVTEVDILSSNGIATSIANFSASMTAAATGTLIQTETSIPTLTTVPTITLIPTASLTATILPTRTFQPIVYPTNTKKPPPPPPDTATSTATATFTNTPVPFGFIVSGVSLNGTGSSVMVLSGSSVTVTYNLQIYNDPACPGCIAQLVTGLGTPGSHGGTCAYDGMPGLYPGVFTTENTTLNASLPPGTYNVEARYYWETGCASALANYPAGAAQASQIIGQITIPSGSFTFNTVSLNGGGNVVTVPAGSLVTVTYNYSVYDDACPGCITQLVTGLETPGSHGGTCAFNGDASLFPGAPGMENVVLTAPLVPGTYSVKVRYSWEFGCADALANYAVGGADAYQMIGQIIVP